MRIQRPLRELGAAVLAVMTATLTAGQPVGAALPAATGQVVVPRGNVVQIAVVLPFTGDLNVVGAGAWNAVQLAVEKHSRIKGFAVHLNPLNGPCGPDDGLNLAAANQVVANPQNVAVIGHFCSPHFKEALPVYQTAGVVTISGSVTGAMVPSFGPDVFNSVAVSDACCPFQDNFTPWYSTVSQLPSDLFWRQHVYVREFGTAPPAYADLYYDATTLLLTKIARVASRDEEGNLVINRAALARAVRATTGFEGVTCDVTLDRTGYRVNDPAALSQCASTDGQHGDS